MLLGGVLRLTIPAGFQWLGMAPVGAGGPLLAAGLLFQRAFGRSPPGLGLLPGAGLGLLPVRLTGLGGRLALSAAMSLAGTALLSVTPAARGNQGGAPGR